MVPALKGFPERSSTPVVNVTLYCIFVVRLLFGVNVIVGFAPGGAVIVQGISMPLPNSSSQKVELFTVVGLIPFASVIAMLTVVVRGRFIAPGAGNLDPRLGTGAVVSDAAPVVNVLNPGLFNVAVCPASRIPPAIFTETVFKAGMGLNAPRNLMTAAVIPPEKAPSTRVPSSVLISKCVSRMRLVKGGVDVIEIFALRSPPSIGILNTIT